MAQGLKESPFDLPKIENENVQWTDLKLQRGFTPYVPVSTGHIIDYSDKAFAMEFGYDKLFIPKSICKGFVQIEFSHNKHGKPTKMEGRYVAIPLWFAEKENIPIEGKFLHVKKE